MAKDAKYGDIAIDGIADDEPIFVLRARDVFAGALLTQYQELRRSAGDEIGAEALQLTINRFRAWPVKRLPT